MQNLDKLLNANASFIKITGTPETFLVLVCNIKCIVVNKNRGGCWKVVVRIRKKQDFSSITSMD